MERRRKHKRYPCTGLAVIHVNVPEPPPRISITALYNISASGMKCAPGIDAAPGTPLEIHLFHFLGISVETKLTGKIVWHANGLAEYMGIVFDEKINEESQPELYRFICESCDQTADQADKK